MTEAAIDTALAPPCSSRVSAGNVSRRNAGNKLRRLTLKDEGVTGVDMSFLTLDGRHDVEVRRVGPYLLAHDCTFFLSGYTVA
jgi:hypothetical protein